MGFIVTCPCQGKCGELVIKTCTGFVLVTSKIFIDRFKIRISGVNYAEINKKPYEASKTNQSQTILLILLIEINVFQR